MCWISHYQLITIYKYQFINLTNIQWNLYWCICSFNIIMDISFHCLSWYVFMYLFILFIFYHKNKFVNSSITHHNFDSKLFSFIFFILLFCVYFLYFMFVNFAIFDIFSSWFLSNFFFYITLFRLFLNNKKYFLLKNVIRKIVKNLKKLDFIKQIKNFFFIFKKNQK